MYLIGDLVVIVQSADMETTAEDTAEIARLLSLTANPRVRQVLINAMQEFSSSSHVGIPLNGSTL